MSKEIKPGGKRPNSGRKKLIEKRKQIWFRIPVFVNPIHEVQLKSECKQIIDEFIVGKERKQ